MYNLHNKNAKFIKKAYSCLLSYMKLKKSFKALQNHLLIILIGSLFFIPYLGEFHLFDWDEVNFAEAAREMIATGDYLTVRIDYEPFHEKPPLFFWMQAISMKIFGINEFAARFPNALIGIITLLIIYSIGKKLFDERYGLLWVLAYLGSFLPHIYFKTGIIDPTFNLFIFLSVYFIYLYWLEISIGSLLKNKKNKYTALAGIFAAMAVLTKGPVGFLLPALSWLVFWFIKRKEKKFQFRTFLFFTSITLLPALIWYSIIFINAGGMVIEEFISYQLRLLFTTEGGHSGPVYFHFIVLFIGCFPASIIMIRAFRKRFDDNVAQEQFKLWMTILLCVVLAIFSLVNTKIIHYSSLAYFPITFLAAYSAYSLIYCNLAWKPSTTWLLSLFGLILGAIFLAIPIIFQNLDYIIPKINDEFTRDILRTPVQWGGWEYLVGAIYILAILVVITLFAQKKILQGIIILYPATAILILTFMPLVVPKIEEYVQGTAINFYKSHKGCDCYVHILDIPAYRYGFLFYSEKPPYLSSYYNDNIPKINFEEWLLNGDIDKPAYFLAKSKDLNKWLKYKKMELVETKYGFAIFKREPVIK
jgi:4-amino-4-deoxy-L-arabinose transferase-like glycosyltransferase